jgi:hypothetical protein
VKLIVMIPALNEEETIGRVIAEIPRTFEGISSVEVLVCDDGSTDGTVQAATAAGADHIVRLRRNFGLTTAFATGLEASLELGADIVVNTDADAQYDAREIGKLIAPILSGEADMVSGDRQVSKLEHMPLTKRYGNQLGSWMLRIVAESPVRDASSGFRAFSRECALRLNPSIGHTYTHQTLIQAAHSGMVVREVPVTFWPSAREGGSSRLIGGVGSHIVKSLGTIVRTLTTYHPLAVLGRLGLLFILAGALVMLIPLADWISQGNTEGHLQSLVAAGVLGLVGLQLIIFGLLADTVSANRRLTEEILYISKQDHIEGGGVDRSIRRPTQLPAAIDGRRQSAPASRPSERKIREPVPTEAQGTSVRG